MCDTSLNLCNQNFSLSFFFNFFLWLVLNIQPDFELRKKLIFLCLSGFVGFFFLKFNDLCCFSFFSSFAGKYMFHMVGF